MNRGMSCRENHHSSSNHSVESLLSMSNLPILDVNSICVLCELFRRDRGGCETCPESGGTGVHFGESR